MNEERFANASRVIVARNVADRVVYVTTSFAEHDAMLRVVYFFEGAPTDDEIELCELACSELIAEFSEIRRAETGCVDVSELPERGARLIGLCYSRAAAT